MKGESVAASEAHQGTWRWQRKETLYTLDRLCTVTLNINPESLIVLNYPSISERCLDEAQYHKGHRKYLDRQRRLTGHTLIPENVRIYMPLVVVMPNELLLA